MSAQLRLHCASPREGEAVAPQARLMGGAAAPPIRLVVSATLDDDPPSPSRGEGQLKWKGERQ
jgi:hypothetical protein